jgi:hypothetical protein
VLKVVLDPQDFRVFRDLLVLQVFKQQLVEQVLRVFKA